MPVDSRAVANFFIGLNQQEGGSPSYELTRPLLERLIVFSDDLYQTGFSVPLVKDTRAADDYEPFFRELRQSLSLYGIDKVDQLITRAPLALSFMLRRREFAEPYEAKFSQRQREFLTTVWTLAREYDVSPSALFWENRGDDWPTDPQDLSPDIDQTSTSYSPSSSIGVAAE